MRERPQRPSASSSGAYATSVRRANGRRWLGVRHTSGRSGHRQLGGGRTGRPRRWPHSALALARSRSSADVDGTLLTPSHARSPSALCGPCWQRWMSWAFARARGRGRASAYAALSATSERLRGEGAPAPGEGSHDRPVRFSRCGPDGVVVVARADAAARAGARRRRVRHRVPMVNA